MKTEDISKLESESNDLISRLKQLRQEKGVTQKQASIDLGYDTSAFGRYESRAKETRPANARLYEIADYFGVTVDYLKGVTNERKPVTNVAPKTPAAYTDKPKVTISPTAIDTVEDVYDSISDVDYIDPDQEPESLDIEPEPVQQFSDSENTIKELRRQIDVLQSQLESNDNPDEDAIRAIEHADDLEDTVNFLERQIELKDNQIKDLIAMSKIQAEIIFLQLGNRA